MLNFSILDQKYVPCLEKLGPKSKLNKNKNKNPENKNYLLKLKFETYADLNTSVLEQKYSFCVNLVQKSRLFVCDEIWNLP